MRQLITARTGQNRATVPSRPLRFGVLAAVWYVFLVGITSCLPTPVSAQESSSEYQVKAAFLYNFTKYIEWPASAFADAGSPFVIGVVGRDPFGGALDRIVDGKTVGGRSLVVKRFKQADDIQACQMLFVSESERDNLGRILSNVERSNTLTVSDFDHFLQHGGMIDFVLENDRVRFEINDGAADRAGLKISSRLLALAKLVRS